MVRVGIGGFCVCKVGVVVAVAIVGMCCAGTWAVVLLGRVAAPLEEVPGEVCYAFCEGRCAGGGGFECWAG